MTNETCALCGRKIDSTGEHWVIAECLACGVTGECSTRTGRCFGCSPNPTPGQMPRFDGRTGKVTVPEGWYPQCEEAKP